MDSINHSVAGIAIKGNLLFVAKRKSGGDLGNKWEFPGGKVEDGESCEEALRREYLEEFGLAIRTGESLGNSEFAHNGKKFLLAAYRVYFGEKDLAGIILNEHTQWQWAALADIKELDFADSDRGLFSALQTYLDRQGGIQQRQARACG